MPIAITREINPLLGDCELTYLPRVPIDVELAAQQHQHFQDALASLGSEVKSLPTEPGLADSVFVEDTALVLDEVAIICRPGAVSRRGEVAAVEALLAQHRSLASIQYPGTLEGGDLLRVGKIIYAGLSTRSNEHGIRQLRAIVADYGYSVIALQTTGCLHLKSAISEVAAGTLLINPDWIDRSAFNDYEWIDVSAQEAHAANALLVGQGVIYPASFPRTLDRLITRGIDVTTVAVSELQKAEGAVTCCSLVFN